jgi:hypothetical protein
MKKIFNYLSLSIALIALPILADAQKNISKSFNGVKRIRMGTASGSCTIKKSSDASVKVELVSTYDGGYEPRVEQEGERLVIKENFSGNNHHGSSNWTLTVPDGITVGFTTGSGDLSVSGMSIDLDATTGSGELIFENLKGDITSTTGSGNVELLNFAGEIKINTGSGDMRVEKSSGDISLNCGSGDIRLLDNKASFDVNTGSGRILASNLTLAGSSRFNTGSGDAEVILAATPTFDLSVNSGSGDAEVDFHGNEIKGEIVMKASKRNGRIEAPFEFDKTEEIDNNNWGDDVTVRKSVVKGNATNRISISTGSGSAVLKK